MTKVRSEWIEDEPLTILGIKESVWHRNVTDGRLRVIYAEEPNGWHLSVSFTDHRGQPSRYPRWDEIAEARYRFIPDDVTMAMVLPPPDEFVAVHHSTFHLHQWVDDA